MEGEPLFWVHLKIDHPFTLEGILYFPKLNPSKPFNEKNIRLYCRQMFVSDNVKDVVPEFMSLLRGVIDSTDIPLNVSRSALQGDPNIRRISSYVVKKVADALKVLSKKDRTKFEAIWEDMALFVKYGVISDTKFDDLVRERVLFKNSEGKYMTLGEYTEAIPAEYTEKMKDKVIYFEKGKSDYTLRAQLLKSGVQTIETEDHIDPHFMQHVETQKKGDHAYTFTTVDSSIADILGTENTTDADIKVKELFAKILVGEVKENDSDKMEVEIQKIKNATSPAYFKVDEQMKRFAKMALSMGNAGMNFPVKKTLVINPANGLIKNALALHEKGGNEQLVERLCHHVEDLALISSEGLQETDREKFVNRSQQLIEDLTANLM